MSRLKTFGLILVIACLLLMIAPVNAGINIANYSVGSYCVTVFTYTGTGSNITNWTVPDGVLFAEYLIVGGGGGAAGAGGGGRRSGGGGAGGLLSGTAMLTPGVTLDVIVGNGGLVGPLDGDGFSGLPSIFLSYTALGGGGASGSAGAGKTGGSGGGSCQGSTAGSGTAGQGYAGASGLGAPNYGCGAGGGSAGVGSAGNTTGSGSSGPGTLSNITGTPTWYAAGGIGGLYTLGNLGTCYPGSSVTCTLGSPGIDGVGGGAVGGGAASGYTNRGGHGTVILKYQPYAEPPEEPPEYENETAVVVNLDVKNSLTGALIQDADVGIKNITSGVWRNSTAPTGLVYFDSTGTYSNEPLSIGQNITLAAGGTGYQDASVTFLIPYSNYRAILNLVPTSIVNATGTGTVVVSVVQNNNGLPISGAGVTLDTGAVGATNSGGAVTFMNVTPGDRTASVSAPDYGYSSTSKSFTLSAGETRLVLVQLIRPGETPVATPVAPGVTTTGNYSASVLNEQGGAGLSEMIGLVLNLWPLIFLLLLMFFMRRVMEG